MGERRLDGLSGVQGRISEGSRDEGEMHHHGVSLTNGGP